MAAANPARKGLRMGRVLRLVRQVASRSRRTARAVVVPLGLGLALGGCYDLEIRQSLGRGGEVYVATDLRFDEDMKDVFAFLEALVSIQPEVPQGLLSDGLCGAVERAIDLAPARTPPPFPLRGRQFREAGRFVCQLEVGLGNADEAFAAMQANPAMLFSPYRVVSDGPRRYRVTLDLASLPEPDEMADITRKYKAAALASTRMVGRDRTISLVLVAPRVVESNGQVAPDGQSVRFTFGWLELVETLLDPHVRRRMSLYAVLEH
jgi:hypothetical protein